MKTKDIVYIALFAAIMAALGLIPKIHIPATSIPITAQSMGAMIAGAVLGAKRGGFAVLLFILLVAVGLPLLAGGRGGLATVSSSPWAGYIWGWGLGAFATGFLVKLFWQRLSFLNAFFCCVVGGVLVVYAVGIPWFSIVSGTDVSVAIKQNLVFIPGDLIKAVIASIVAIKVKQNYPLVN